MRKGGKIQRKKNHVQVDSNFLYSNGWGVGEEKIYTKKRRETLVEYLTLRNLPNVTRSQGPIRTGIIFRD